MRKDVLIARITFAILCLAVIGIIVSAGTRISASRKARKTAETKIETNTGTEAVENTTEITAETETAEEVTVPADIYVKTTATVNLRASASTDAEVLKTLDAGETLKLVSEDNNWAEVVSGDQTGYVSMDYIETVSDDSTGTTVNNATGTEDKVLKTTTDSVRMRAAAGTDADIITTIEAGVTLEIISEADGWAQITYQGQTGYVSTDFLQ